MKDISINVPSNAQKVMDVLSDLGYEVYVVGGCVRDSIMGRNPNDWDITTNATPTQVQDAFENTIPTGIQHGTITVMMHGEGYEVTTYRIDGEYGDNRRPNEVKFTSNVIEDLSRRDFTINAMAYNHEEGLIDPYNGLHDIKNKVIACVGDAEDRFNEDSLRMLRALRFSAQLGFKMCLRVRSAIAKNSYSIKNVSMERVQSEFNKILLADPSVLEFGSGLNIASKFIPEMISRNGFMTCKIIEPTLHLRLSALFHDIALDSVKTTESILKRLKYDNKTIKKVLTLIGCHDRIIDADKKSIKKFLNELGGHEVFNDWCSLRLANILAQNPIYSREKVGNLYKLKYMATEIAETNEPFQIKDLDINGNDLIALGFSGKEIGEVLKRLLDEVIEHPNTNDKEYLIMFAKSF